MKQVTYPPLPRPRRLNVAQAKARLSEVLRDAPEVPTIIHNRGRDVAILLDVATYERLTDAAGAQETPAAVFLRDVDALRREYGGGGNFAPTRVTFVPREPFEPRRTRKAK